jgi:mRNA-degrading endonuclease RelE of RelBE toxin-antitoxin system
VKVAYTDAANRQLKKLDPPVAARIQRVLAALGPEPWPNVRSYQGDTLRLRVGDWRVIFIRDGDGILVLRVGHRRVYDDDQRGRRRSRLRLTHTCARAPRVRLVPAPSSTRAATLGLASADTA